MKYKDEDIIKALQAANGILAVAARSIGCDRGTIYERMKVSPEVQAAYDQANEVTLDMAEGRLIALVNKDSHKDHFSAIRYYLRTKGKKRGYVERQEITGADGEAVNIHFVPATKDDG
jgi:hypothetical protein